MASIKALLFLFFFFSFLALSCLKEIKVVDDSVAPEQLQPFSKGFDFSRLLSSRPPRAAPTFDCDARILAYQFARSYLLPNLGPLSTVYEALELNSLCQKSLHELERQIAWEQTKQSFRQKVAEKEKLRKKYYAERKVRSAIDPFHLTAPNTLYVDANNGKDTNPGTFSQPFQTIQKAIKASRSLSGQTAILLRQGTFYLAEPLQLGAEDSDLIILSFRNERVFISGGIPLKTQWKPYNVSSKAALQNFANANNVYGRAMDGADTDTIKYLGTFDSVEPCQQGCLNYASRTGVPCRSYTYHTKQLGGPWAGQCFAVINEVWGPVPQANVISGRFVQPNIYVADLSQQGIKSIPGLQTADGTGRKIRARYPDGHPETTFFPAGWILNAKSWIPPAQFNTSQTIVVDQPSRNDTTMFQKYTIGIGGACEIFTPPESYWCSPYNEGGGATVFNTPRGLSFDPSTIYGPVLKNLAGSTLHTWHPYHWASWMYHIDTFDPSTNTITWTKGGFQGARGTGDANRGGEFYFENSLDLLDSPEEYYFDEKSQLLYYFYNGTGTPPSSLQLVASNLKTLVEAVGAQDRPVRNLTFQGITFVNAAYTYMDPHGVPSGGDWALQRSGALYFEGTENLLINNCTFMRLDGNGMMLSGYHRHATIANSEFAWIGDTPLGLWGHTQGIDGTNGEQPRFTNIISNIFRELGHFEKQSSPVFQAKTCQTLIYKNVMFNGPRALINFNDGFGGGNIITENLLFNANRETSDQGPFNSWDRMPFLTEVRDGKTPSLTPAYNDINTNFFICNYGSNMCIDNDDGSSYYLNHHNFEVYGGHKSDFGGHNKFTYNTLEAFSQDYEGGLCGDFNDAIPGFVDGYYNNTCVQAVWVPYINLECDPKKPDPSRLPKLNNNKVYNSNNSLSVKCGDKVFTEEEWQALGFDQGTQSFPLPTDDEIITWAKEILGMS